MIQACEPSGILLRGIQVLHAVSTDCGGISTGLIAQLVEHRASYLVSLFCTRGVVALSQEATRINNEDQGCYLSPCQTTAATMRT